MTQDFSSAADERFVDLICAYEEALTQSTECQATDESLQAEDPTLVERLRTAQRGLHALDRVRRRWQPDAEVPSGAFREEPDTNRDLETQPYTERTIGRFRIQHEIGCGGVGVVFLAFDPRLRRRIALKVPREESLASEELRARFLREAEAAARLDHAHIVGVYDVGEAGPLCYIASEYCSGPTLRQWLRESSTPIEPRLAAEWAARLAAAVQHAHGRGVLHRDIKPGNVLLAARQPLADGKRNSKAEARWTPKLADFGMAKLLESHELVDATRSGTLIGTIPYMAPEQAEGRTSEIDVRSDVYGLGALLYELLTRRPPYQGDTDADTLRQLLLTEIAPPSQQREGVPRDLEAICLKCLEKDPRRRYATAQELSDDLQSFLSGHPTEARPPRALERVAMWVRRRPVAAAGAFATVVVALTILSVVGFYNARLSSALQQTEFERTRAERAALVSGGLLYSANVRLAYDAWSKRNRDEAIALLSQHIPEAGEPDQREFAWHYLWQQCHPDTQDLLGHGDEVFSVEFSPDGSLLVSASKDGTARLWDLATGTTRFTLNGHASEVTSVAFHPKGNRVATGSEDHTIRVWHPATGELVGVLSGHTDHVLCVAFSPDGDWLATGGRDASVRIWKADSLDLVATLDAARGNVRALDFSADGTLLVADESGSLRCFDVRDWSLKAQTHVADEAFFAAGFSDDLPWIAVAGRQEVGRVFHLSETGLDLTAELAGGHTEWIQDVDFSPRDNSLATAGKDGLIQLWVVGETELKPRSLLGHEGRVWDVSWSPDGRSLASAGADHSVKIWHIDSVGSPSLTYPLCSDQVNHLVFAPDGQRLFAGDKQGVVRAWDPHSRRLVRVVARLGAEISALAVSPDGAQLAANDFQGRTHVWSLDTWSHAVLTQSSEGIGHRLAWSSNGDSLAATRDERTVTVIDVATGHELFRRIEPEHIQWLQYLDKGDVLVVCSDKARFYDLSTGQLQHELNGARYGCISHDSRTLAISTGGHIVQLWDIQAVERRRRLIAPTHKTVGPIAFSPNDRTLAVGCRHQGDLTLWDARTGQIAFTYETATIGGLAATTFSPCGQYLLASNRSKPGQIVQWSVSSQQSRKANGQASATASLGTTVEGHGNETLSYNVAFVPRPEAGSGSIHSFRVSLMSQSDETTTSNPLFVVEKDLRFGGPQIIPTTRAGVTSCAVGDIDNDGDMDIAAANPSRYKLLWYANDGVGNFTSVETIDRSFRGAEEVVLADLDRNGWLDAIVPSAVLDEIRWYPDVGNPANSTPPHTLPGIDRPHALITADLNADGFQDVIWAEHETDRVGAALNESGHSLRRITDIAADAGSADALAAGDFDQDGDLDVLACSNRQGMISWAENDGQGQASAQHSLLSYHGTARRPDVADLDSDGDVDIVVPLLEEDRAVLLENLGNGQFRASQLPTISETEPCSVAARDLDGDGDLDLVLGGRTKALITVLLNDGTGRFTRSSRIVNTQGQNFDDVAVTDLNGDGIADIVFAGYRGPGLGWHAGTGVAFQYQESAPRESRDVPWEQKNGLTTTLPARMPNEASPFQISLRFESEGGRSLTARDFKSIVARVVVYRDTNHNGLIESQWEPIVAELDAPTIQDGMLRIPLQPPFPLPHPAGGHAGVAAEILGFAELIETVNRWAGDHGHPGAIPICDGNHRDNVSPTEVVVFSSPSCKLIDLTIDELHAVGALPLSDHAESDALYVQNSGCIDVWARAHGYRAGVLVGSSDTYSNVLQSFRALVFVGAEHERRLLSIANLDYPVGFEALCHQVQQHAEALGFIAGIPVLINGNHTVDCVFFPESTAKRRPVLKVELR